MKVGFVLLVLLPYIATYRIKGGVTESLELDSREKLCKNSLRDFEVCLEPFFDTHEAFTRDYWKDYSKKEIFLKELNNAKCLNSWRCSAEIFETEVRSKLKDMLRDIYEEADICIFEGIMSGDDVTSCLSNVDEDTDENSNSEESTSTDVPSTTTQSSTVAENTESTTEIPEVSSTTVEDTSTTETTNTVADSTTVNDESSTLFESESTTDSTSTTEDYETDWIKSSEETTTEAYWDKRIKILDEASEPQDEEKREEILGKEIEILDKEIRILGQKVGDHSDESADSFEEIYIPRNSSGGKMIYLTTTMVFAVIFLFLFF
ncbi:hypothetical protein GCK72_025125 [Caenorhabditis remanei]|uniref:DUF19 domain-containing protein n=1 Tax=Caenorhabditis remanei TaxID=31234 RepID=A0A6A5G144_CAERE|nr:hypothetical protein GCK72_025125 [Caenorhabditis remanei]KAF1748658.1 hypothetical protein GCK72_025125 [Caenorhabditis remanei]